MSEQYEVGYGKPPKHSQFKTGQSGNPKGRKKGVKNINTILDGILNEKVVLSENGRTYKVSKKQALCRRLVNKGLSGDMKAIGTILSHLFNQALESEVRSAALNSTAGIDQEIIANFLRTSGADIDGKQ